MITKEQFLDLSNEYIEEYFYYSKYLELVNMVFDEPCNSCEWESDYKYDTADHCYDCCHRFSSNYKKRMFS